MKKTIKNEKLDDIIEITQESSVGQIFKSVRTKSGLKLEEIANDLKIRKIYLEAIEKNDYPNIPAYPYGLGFIRSYAKYFGLNEDLIVNKFKSEAKPESEKVNNAPASKEEVFEAAIPSKKNIYIAIAALVVISIFWSLVSGNGDEEALIAKEAQIQEVVTVEGTPDASLNVNVNEGSYVPEEEFASQEVLEEQKINPAPMVKVFEETWVEVKTENKLYLSKVLKAGDEYVLPKADGLILSVGKVNGADLFIDGKQLNIVKPGKKINIKLDAYLNKEAN